MVRQSLPYLGLTRNNPEYNHKVVQAEIERFEKFKKEAAEKGMELRTDIGGYHFIHKTDNSKNYFMPSGMLNGSAVAKDLFPIEPLPPGALPTYDRDIDVSAMIIEDNEVKETDCMIDDGPAEEDINNFAAQFLSHEDPYNPFSSNYNGEPVGPDSFGGDDYGSHYMSVSVEKMREDFRKRLYKEDGTDLLDEVPRNLSQVSQFRQKQLEGKDQLPLSEWEEFHQEVMKAEQEAEDEKNLEFQRCVQARIEAKEKESWVQIHPQQSTSNAYSDSHGWIQLYSGRKFSPLNPKVEDIDIEDIAHALSNMCRFTGHCKSFYSVAQHCVLVSYLSGTHALWGLLHDASEAYICDIARPVKRLDAFKPYLEIEKNIQAVICQKFGLQPQEPAIVKQADTNLLHTEARDLMSPLHPDWVSAVKPLPFKIEPLQPAEAKKLFLERYKELMGVEGK